MTAHSENIEKSLRERARSHDGTTCPHCGSFHLTGDSFDQEGDEVSQIVSCADCGRHWTDVYRLHSVVLDGDRPGGEGEEHLCGAAADDDHGANGCLECSRSRGPHYRGPCEH
jgi:hypothetical protein